MQRPAFAEKRPIATRLQPTAQPTQPVAVRATRRLPATRLPAVREDRRVSSVLSVALHVLIVFLIAGDVALHTGDVKEVPQGAGGPGPVGGGGGGHRGTGDPSPIHYVRVAAAAPQAAVVPPPVVIPAPPKPQPKPVVQEVAIKPPELTPTQPEVKLDAPKLADPSAAQAGTGGGTGKDGSAGNGPGSGGGNGSGIGTGRGSGIGPGTGGGVQANYPPSPTELFIPPLPMPDKVRGFHLIAEYDVDSTGKVLDFKFTPTKDGGYNRKLDEVLRSFKFKPGTRPDGTPIRMKAQIVYDF